MIEQTQTFDLKIINKTQQQIQKDDYIFYEGDIWICTMKSLLKFQNLNTKQQKVIGNLKNKVYYSLQKLQLIAENWQVTGEGKIILHGRQLGLGKRQKVQVVGMSQFEQLQVIKRDKQLGKNRSYKVIMCSTRDHRKCVIDMKILL